MLDKLNAILGSIASFPGQIYDFFTDPIWAVGWAVALIVLACTALSWFFPKARPYFGVGALLSIIYAIGFRKGQKAEDVRKQSEIDNLKSKLQAQRQNRQGWW